MYRATSGPTTAAIPSIAHRGKPPKPRQGASKCLRDGAPSKINEYYRRVAHSMRGSTGVCCRMRRQETRSRLSVQRRSRRLSQDGDSRGAGPSFQYPMRIHVLKGNVSARQDVPKRVGLQRRRGRPGLIQRRQANRRQLSHLATFADSTRSPRDAGRGLGSSPHNRPRKYLEPPLRLR